MLPPSKLTSRIEQEPTRAAEELVSFTHLNSRAELTHSRRIRDRHRQARASAKARLGDDRLGKGELASFTSDDELTRRTHISFERIWER